MSQATEIWKSLRENQLVVGDEPESTELESPWYVKTLLAFSGWFASIFVFAFMATAFSSLLDNTLACLVVGGLMIAGACRVLKWAISEFSEHLGLSISLAGQILITIAVFNSLGESQAPTWMLTALLQVVLAITMPNFVHRVVSSFLATFSFSAALSAAGIPYLFSGLVMFASAFIWLNEFKYPQHQKMLPAIGYGITLALIQIKGSAILLQGAMTWSSEPIATPFWLQPWHGELLCCAAALFVVWQLLKRYSVATGSPIAIAALASTAIIGIASLEASGITAGVIIILLGFSASNRILMGLGVVSLLFYVSSYYYLLDTTLLEKSVTTFLIGAALLLTRWMAIQSSMFNGESSDA